MKIAVIVPAYNGGEQLCKCLMGIATSERKPDEVVVVDDGSTDDSVGVVGELGFRLLSIPDGPQGPARARNYGARGVAGKRFLGEILTLPVVGSRLERQERIIRAGAPRPTGQLMLF